jgi:8-oxo-dGTP diphosphatase
MKRVVSGALIREGRVLMGLRKSTGMRPDLWELPGGKVEPDESPTDALEREWQEEVAFHVLALHRDLIASVTLSIDTTLIVELYLVRQHFNSEPHQPVAHDHQKLAWVDPLCAVKWLPCSPAFYLHFSQLLPYVEATRATSTCDFVGDEGCSNERCLRCHPTREAFLDDLAEWTIR